MKKYSIEEVAFAIIKVVLLIGALVLEILVAGSHIPNHNLYLSIVMLFAVIWIQTIE